MVRRLALLASVLLGCGFKAPGSGSGHDGGPLDATDASGATDAADVDAASDAPPGTVCYGSFGVVCLAVVPTGNIDVNTPTTINTDAVGCLPTVTGTTIPNPCVVAAAMYTVNSPLTATGSRVLVIVATNQLTVNSTTVDVSSHGGAVGSRGAGAPLTCAGATLPTGGGGGAGGSFFQGGGDGNAGNNGNGGTPNPTLNLVTVRGGCPGSHGGGANTNGGLGGGAIALIAPTISINGTIAANGAGGRGGLQGGDGGGGGGSGGAIILDTQNLTFNGSGRLMAEGGGGGEGSPNGGSGNDATDPSIAAPGTASAGGTGGGNGGDGGSGGTTGPGSGGGGGGGNAGGGAGGGGAGFVHALDPQFGNNGMSFPNFN